MTGFVGLETFGSLLTLCRHSQNLNLVYNDVLVLFCLGVCLCVFGRP